MDVAFNYLMFDGTMLALCLGQGCNMLRNITAASTLAPFTVLFCGFRAYAFFLPST